MAKYKSPHVMIYKLHSSRLADAKWDLSLPLDEAIENGRDVVELSDSQILRFIDEINGIDVDAQILELKAEIKRLKMGERSAADNRKIKKLYKELYEAQFRPDYVCIIMDSLKQYDRCNKGFKINGIKYRRLLGTNNGIKNSTIIYVSETMYPLLMERINCGRNMDKKLIPAKLEAYQALVCSGSIPVSMPNGIIVVNDCFTTFKDDIIYIDDSTTVEPILTEVHDKEVTINANDGFGFMMPELSMRWSGELNNRPDDYIPAVNTRGIPWTKGMLFTFDFQEFASEVADTYQIRDAWGDLRDVRDAEVILSTSMLKLWDCYKSWEDYEANFKKYNYGFAVSKVAPYELEEERSTNYQFLQSYELSDEDIEELVGPTVDNIKEVLGLDYRKAILYLKGTNIDPHSLFFANAGVAEALMVEPELINDSYVRSMIYDSIKTRIKRAKTGVLNVAGNFAIIGGDPYSLAQSMFGLPITGLLKRGEIYHKFWTDRGVTEVCCFRAPMTSHNNIRKQKVASTRDMEYWYQYITTCILFNSWDTTAEALNGCDYDGDLCFTTDNEVLVRNTRKLPAIFCVQRSGTKIVPTEADIIESNKLSFGDAIGATTNVITSQICAMAKFDPDSDQYKEMHYRVLCGQLYQQNCIDKAKGIVCKPMPNYWFNSKGLRVTDDDDDDIIARKEYLRELVVDRKPYFFIYNYDHLYSRYSKYMEQVNNSFYREFGRPFDGTIDQDDEQQVKFMEYYNQFLPIDMTPCTTNKICWYIEDNLNSISMETKDLNFDYTILKHPEPTYTDNQYYYVKNLLETEYEKYKSGMKELIKQMRKEEIHGQEKVRLIDNYNKSFILKSNVICPDEILRCDVLLDIAYKSNSSKKFVWELCGPQLIRNLLLRHDNQYYYPTRISFIQNEQYQFKYKGEPYQMVQCIVEDELEYE